jgi:DNA-binding ferritin-like protein
MAKSRFDQAAEKIGAAVGRADRTARKLKKAGIIAKKELEQISKEVESLKRRLQKSAKRLKRAMA